MLFRLGAEEDAIVAKQSDFTRGAEVVMNDLLKSWNQRLRHEADGLRNVLVERRGSMEKAIQQLTAGGQDEVPKAAELQTVSRRLQTKGKVIHDSLQQLFA